MRVQVTHSQTSSYVLEIIPDQTRGLPPSTDGGPIEAMKRSIQTASRLSSFRHQLMAAPLKLFVDPPYLGEFSKYLPPSTDGGPIEAIPFLVRPTRQPPFRHQLMAAPLKLPVVGLARGVRPPTFRHQLMAAPLKRLLKQPRREAPIVLPPSTDGGPIEARCSPAQHTSTCQSPSAIN